MATVHLGRLLGPAGFARTVAIKRLHPHLLADPSFTDMFVDEARLAARIRHPNVVPTLDVYKADGELLLVMEYVDGDALSQLFRQAKGKIPVSIAVAVVSEMLHGLHAAHEATSETGAPLGIVHRDVSPQNVLVGADGVARLVDFGVARAAGRLGTTSDGDIKGKLAYMAPEQIRREPMTRRADIFAAGIVLWELLTGERLFAADNEAATLEKILVGWVAPPSSIVRDLPPELDAIVLRALDPQPSMRFASAREMAVALEDAYPRALGREVAEWVEATATDMLRARRELVAQVERDDEPADRREAPASAPRLIVHPETTADLATRPLAIAFERSDQTVLIASRPQSKPPTIARRIAVVLGSAAVVVLALIHFVLGSSKAAAAPREELHAPPPPATVLPIQAPSVETAPLAPPPSPPPREPVVAPTKEATPPPAKPTVRSAPVRRAPPPAARAASGCVGRYDPATKKTIYMGDCE
jgi:eukaryotic-like serine/threonine-protein kinase